MNTDKEFIPYEQALALKELGFDEICIATYDEDEYFEFLYFEQSYYTIPSKLIQAPLFQQCFRWFREKYGLHQYIKQYCGESFYFHIEDMVHPRRFDEYTVEMLRSFNESTSQEEAELACLKRLIEICKNK